MSNYGASSSELEKAVQERRGDIAKREGAAPEDVPTDAVTGSGSGVDSGISPAYAELQAPRVAREQGMSTEEVRSLIEDNTEHASLGFLGEDAVNVTTLNRALPLPPSCS